MSQAPLRDKTRAADRLGFLPRWEVVEEGRPRSTTGEHNEDNERSDSGDDGRQRRDGAKRTGARRAGSATGQDIAPAAVPVAPAKPAGLPGDCWVAWRPA